MTKYNNFSNLKNPPAMEVVFGVSIEDDSNFDIQKLNISGENFRNTFPTQEDIKEIIIDANDKNSHVSTKNLGYAYKTSDNEELTQFRSNGFTYSKLGNYAGGDDFLKNVLSTWSTYRDSRDKFKISNIGLRYINVITVDNFNYNYKEFFKVFLETTDEIGKIEKHRYKYTKDFVEQKCTSVVNFYLDTIKSDGEAKFILDIDIIKKDIISPLSNKDLEEHFKDMRYCKNVIFFSTLEKEILEQYK